MEGSKHTLTPPRYFQRGQDPQTPRIYAHAHKSETSTAPYRLWEGLQRDRGLYREYLNVLKTATDRRKRSANLCALENSAVHIIGYASI